MRPLRAVPVVERSGDAQESLVGLRARVVDHLRLGEVEAVLDELERIPTPLLLEELDLSAALGFAGGLAGEPVLARALLTELQTAARAATIPPDGLVAVAHLDLALCGWEGRLDDIADPVEVLLSELGDRDPRESGYIIDGVSAQAALATGLLTLGRLDEAVTEAERALVLDELVPVSRQAVMAAGIKALALAWQASPERAREAAREARAILSRYHGVGATPIFAHAATCWVGTPDQAAQAFEPMARAVAELPVPAFNALHRMASTKALIRSGDTHAAAQTLEQAHDELQAMPQPGYFTTIATRLDDELCAMDRDRANTLTPVEIRALQMLAQGATRSEIATELNYSLNTIKAYLRRAYRKLDATNRDEAIRHAHQLDLITPTNPPP